MGTRDVPVALSATFLLDLVWISVDMAGLGKVTGEVFLSRGGPIGQGDVVTVVEFMGTSHWLNRCQLREYSLIIAHTRIEAYHVNVIIRV